MTSTGTELYWLPSPQWPDQLVRLRNNSAPTLADFAELASFRLDYSQLNALDRLLAQRCDGWAVTAPQAQVRLAILGSSTTTHLHAGIRVAGLRRGLWMEIHQGSYGQFWQQLIEPDAVLAEFAPTSVLLALDARQLVSGLSVDSDRVQRDHLIQATLESLQQGWDSLRSRYNCQLIQQLPLPVFENLMGNNEHCLPGSRMDYLYRVNAAIRECAAQAGVDVLSLDRQAAQDGLSVWHDPRLWLQARMEVSPAAGPLFGELLVRVIAARQGRSAKCLVLDLDNTLWGGEVGEVGLSAIVLGQGSAVGEAYLEFQRYLLELHQRGVILAVCSKNNHETAFEVFAAHPEMLLKPHHIASFKANWNPKPDNVRDIALELNIGLEFMVFVDDSAFERALMRSVLAAVNTPELPDDAVLFPRLLADAGYFESVTLTAEDRRRGATYQSNKQRLALREKHVDLEAYLNDLDMRLAWQMTNPLDLERVVQLINKTNQFNLTSRRYNSRQMEAMMVDPNIHILYYRLSDQFGDSGIIGIVILKQRDQAMLIDTFLLSCRVFGRRVEHGILNVVASFARSLGATWLIGEYRATEKNNLVREFYPQSGFKARPSAKSDNLQFELSLNEFEPFSVPSTICRADP